MHCGARRAFGLTTRRGRHNPASIGSNSPRESLMSQTRRILVVDDEDDLRQALAEQLGLHEEFAVTEVNTAGAALEAVRAQPPDLVVMDVGLPNMDGREAVKQMRREGFRRPVIMLTAHDSDADTVIGLESGANDYVAKPFRFAV